MDDIQRWAGQLGYDRVAGALLRRSDGCPADHPFAPEVRSMFAPSGAVPVAAIFCIDRAPTVCLVERTALASNVTHQREQIRQLCERLWNQNLARAVLVAGSDNFEVWSVDNPKVRHEVVAASENTAIAAWSVEGLHSGQVLKRRNAWFDPRKRVDKVLLDNVMTLIEQLLGVGLNPATARELIAKVIFVAYLEDREIVTEAYRQEHKLEPIYDLLDRSNAAGLEALFEQLRSDFNGDFLKPSSPMGQVWRGAPDRVFALLHNFLSRTVLRSGQGDFWRYDFSQMPIELIAGVYETFLASKSDDERYEQKALNATVGGESKGANDARRKQGAYYTPRFLADWVVNLALDGRDILQQRIFDGACGSGMLLTAAFRRMIRANEAEAKRIGLGPEATDFDARRALLLGHIFGADIDEDACRLTAFSLYLALLSDLTPRDLAVLQKGGRKLPELLGYNLHTGRVRGNFFSRESEDANRGRFTVFLSNPPWRELRAGDPDGPAVEEWLSRQPQPSPHFPNRQIATAFALAAADCLESGGRAALILPVNPFVSAEPTRRAFRGDLLARYHVTHIVNFSDMRRLIFTGAVHPFVVLVVNARPTKNRYESVSHEEFEYWTPKTDIALAFGRLAVHGADRTNLAASSLIDEMPHLRLRYWGTEQDMTLLRRLWRHGHVRDLMDSSFGWMEAKGFHLKDEDQRRPQESWYIKPPNWMRERPFLHADKLANNLPIVETRALTPFEFDRIAREPPRRLFEGPRVLWPDGTHPENGVKAVFADQSFTFQHSLGVLSAPNTECGRLTARFLTCYLRSPMGVWLSLLLSGSVASERPKLHVEELLEWPFWPPERHPHPDKANHILREVDQHLKTVEEEHELLRPGRYTKIKSTLDNLVFEYFGFHEEERVLVDELATFAGPSLQPTSLRYDALIRPLRAPPSRDLLEKYCDRVRNIFNRWRDATGGEGEVAVVPWTARTVPLGAAVLRLSLTPGDTPKPCGRFEDDAVLGEIARALARVTRGPGDELLMVPNLTIVDGERIMIVKPLVARFWLQRAAVEDASQVASEIQSIELTRS